MELQHRMPSVWVPLSYCVEYNILFYCTFIIYLIIKFYYIVNMEPFKGVHHIAFFIYV